MMRCCNYVQQGFRLGNNYLNLKVKQIQGRNEQIKLNRTSEECAALPEGVACLSEGLGLQAELWLDDSSDNETAVAGALAQNAP